MDTKCVLFDLDGTIVDSSEGIANSFKYALNKLGIQVSNKNDIYKFIGPPLTDTFRDYYKMNQEKIDKAVMFYREIYGKEQIYNVKIYGGIIETLKKLKELNYAIGLSTSKPTVYAQNILSHLNIIEFFDNISGSSLIDKKESKSDIIRNSIKNLNIKNLENIIMVGDRYYDILGAKSNGIKSIGVLYGFGSLEEFKEYGADYIVNDTKELKEKIIQIFNKKILLFN